MELILDTSVIIKWFLDEKFSEEALKYRHQHLEGEIALVAPAILSFEIVNALCTKSDVGLTAVLSALESFYFAGIKEYPLTEELSKAVSQFSKRHEISSYDAACVALAQKLNCQFITADKKLYRKVKELEFVRLLGNN